MNSQLDLFDTEGSRQLLPGDGSAMLYSDVWTPAQAAALMDTLQKRLPWEQHTVTVYGKQHLQPRLCAWFGDPTTSYTYSGLTLQPHPWTRELADIHARCVDLAGVGSFNSLLANLYRDGNDTVGWHADDEPGLGPDPTIVSVSLGAVRRFDLRHKITGETIKTPLPSGSVLIMSDGCQSNWNHQIARTAKVNEPRINLTFRQMGGSGPPRRSENRR